MNISLALSQSMALGQKEIAVPLYYVLVGVPASGKTTYAKRLRCKIVSPDVIRDTQRVSTEKAYEIARREIRATLKAQENVALDATNTIRGLRATMIKAGRPYANKIVCIWMDTPLEICIARYQKRIERGEISARYQETPKLYGKVIERYCRRILKNPPDLREGFDAIRRIEVQKKRRK